MNDSNNIPFVNPHPVRWLALGVCTREQLRNLAREFNIPRGRNKADTLKNLRRTVEENIPVTIVSKS